MNNLQTLLTALLEEGLSPTVRCSTGLVRAVFSLHNRYNAAPAGTNKFPGVTHRKSRPSDLPLESAAH